MVKLFAFLLAMLIMFAGSLCVLSVLAAFLSKWSSLAETYRASGSFAGQRWRCQSAQISRIKYSLCLTVGANHKALYVAMPWMIPRLYPPLLIPWSDVSVHRRGRVFRAKELRFRGAPHVPFQIGRRLARRLAEAAGPSWPVEETT